LGVAGITRCDTYHQGVKELGRNRSYSTLPGLSAEHQGVVRFFLAVQEQSTPLPSHLEGNTTSQGPYGYLEKEKAILSGLSKKVRMLVRDLTLKPKQSELPAFHK
jgi:hypothetical protein